MKTVYNACLCANASMDMLKDTVGKTIAQKLTQQSIKQLPFEVIKKVNQGESYPLVTKFGQTGAINLGKTVPLVGGVSSRIQAALHAVRTGLVSVEELNEET